MDRQRIRKLLEEYRESAEIIEDAPMARYTSFRAGGAADLMVIPEDAQTLRQILQLLSEEECPFVLLGNGTNILVRDGGYRGVIVKPGEGFQNIRTEGNELVCGSGALLSVIAKAALHEGLAGFEFASGIPGSVGGAVFMNAGAYGGEIKDVLKEAALVSKDGRKEYTASAEELDLGYRHSALQESGDVVTEVRIALQPGDPEAIRERMAELTRKRNEKQPVSYPSAGSFFKRPEGYFAGKLIQDAGLKGLTVGGAQVSELHAGFIINTGGATAADILQLMDIVRGVVFEQNGVMLEPEVRIIGEV